MKDRSSFEITSKQLVFLLVGAMLGTGILTLPRITAKAVEQDAWFVVVLGAILPFISLFFTNKLYKKYPDKDFIGLTNHLVGKFLGAIIVTVFALYCISAGTIILRLFIEAVTVFLLPKTPLLFKLSLMLFACAYMAANSIKIIGRALEFLIYILIPLLLLVIIVLVQRGSIQYLMPVFNHSFTDYLKGAMTTSFAYSGFELFIVYYPFVVRRNEAFKAGVIGLILTMLLYGTIVISTIAVYGARYIQAVVWPTLRLVAVAELPVVERLEFVFLMAWVGIAFRPIVNQYFCSSYLIARVLKLKTHKTVVCLLFPVIIILAMLPKDIFMVFKISDYVGEASIAVGVLIPIMMYFISLFKKEKKVKKSA